MEGEDGGGRVGKKEPSEGWQRENRKLLMKEASAIYQAPTDSEARTRLQAWVQQWQGCAPDAVATLQRDFEATIVFYRLETVTREWIRTTSLLERANRAFRTKFRQKEVSQYTNLSRALSNKK